ncbi:hypothetical protein GQ44DRAFT_829030 [Phaeosphaeriaceae sp. PMI808]|nr:hypothetical protein GQ44DRAFT_829030 [Phaeosphaeriaceae sp. PMI808]
MYGGQSAGPNVAPQLQTQPNTYPRPQNVASHSSRMPAQARTTDYVSSSTTPTLASHRAGANSYGRSSREAQTGQSRSSATNDTSGTKAHTNNGNVAPSSGSAYVEIGKALYNAETNEYRFRCHLEDCTEKTIRRIQDLKRHYEDFHGGVKYECLSEGCGKNFARKDKFRKHCREAHGEYTEYPFQEHAAENPGFCTGVG